jgi:hypothetical protein
MLLEILTLSPYGAPMNNPSKIALCACFFALITGCESLDYQQGPALRTQTASQQKDRPLAQNFETAHNVPAHQYLDAKFMRSEHHTVAPMAWNDGYANSYEIETTDHVYVVQGTHQARERVREIQATEILRDTHTVEAVAQTAALRTINLVETPVRALTQGAARFGSVRSPIDALMVVPSGAVEILGKLGNGVKEFGVTGARIASGVGSTKCSGFGCVANAGEDIWSGFNSIVGKKGAAVELHQRLGTDPYSDNQVLQREIDRLAYAESYVGTGLKTGIGIAGISILSTWTTNVGVYNNAEFLAIYEDAHKRRNQEKAEMLTWGTDENMLNRLYENEAYTHTTRTRMFTALQRIHDRAFRARYVGMAADAQTRYVADGRLAIIQYFADLDQKDQIKDYAANTPMAIAIGVNNRLILPFVADDLHWTREISAPVAKFAQMVEDNPEITGGEIHVLGHATEMFKQSAQQNGLKVVEYSLMP